MARVAAAAASLLVATGVHATANYCVSGANTQWAGCWNSGVYDASYGGYTNQASITNPPTSLDSEVVCVNANPYLTTTASSTGSCSASNSAAVKVGTFTVTANPSTYNPTPASGNVGSVVAIPATLNPSGPLVIFLGGSSSNPQGYSYLIERAARSGAAAAISLQYENTFDIGNVCGNSDSCYTSARGEVFYGNGQSYPLGSNDPNNPNNPNNIGTSFSLTANGWTHIDVSDSVVNRIVLLLDYLQKTSPAGTNLYPNYWSRFLVNVNNSPYRREFTANHTGAYPVWPNIILIGHSQGGGEAAFAASTLYYSSNGQSSNVARGIMLSAPEDNYTANLQVKTASWIKNSPAAVVAKLRGLRHIDLTGASDEGPYGKDVKMNWDNFGISNGVTNGLSGTEDQIFVSAYPCLSNYASGGTPKKPVVTDCGSSPPMTSTHRYAIGETLSGTLSSPALNAHNAGGADSLATDIDVTNTDPTTDAVNNDSSITGNSRRATLYVSTLGLCNSGASCSGLNPNVAYIWGQLLTGN